jgi:hypothetical protein
MAETVRRQGKVATFFSTRVAFTSGEENVSKIAQGLNALGNALLAPTRYLMSGRTVTCVTMGNKTSSVGQSIIFGNVRGGPSKEEKRGWGKAALSAMGNVGLGLVAIVGTPLGALVKGLAMISPELRKRCNQAADRIVQQEKRGSEAQLLRDIASIAIFIAKEDKVGLARLFEEKYDQEKLQKLLSFLGNTNWFGNAERDFLIECWSASKTAIEMKLLEMEQEGAEKGALTEEDIRVVQKCLTKRDEDGLKRFFLGKQKEGSLEIIWTFIVDLNLRDTDYFFAMNCLPENFKLPPSKYSPIDPDKEPGATIR